MPAVLFVLMKFFHDQHAEPDDFTDWYRGNNWAQPAAGVDNRARPFLISPFVFDFRKVIQRVGMIGFICKVLIKFCAASSVLPFS